VVGNNNSNNGFGFAFLSLLCATVLFRTTTFKITQNLFQEEKPREV
jgi:hypothetical protein